MKPETSLNDGSSFGDYLSIIRRRRWIVLQALIIIPAVAVALSYRKPTIYVASADVFLNRQNPAASIAGSSLALPQQSDETEAALARFPALAARTVKVADVTDMSAQEFLRSSSVGPKTEGGILGFWVTDAVPARAIKLATTYAREFTIFRRQLDTAALERARREIQTKLTGLEESGEGRSPLHSTLVEREQQLSTAQALQTSNGFLVNPAVGYETLGPRPVRDGVFGLALALLIGVGLALLRDALDTRVRSAEEIRDLTGLPLLARIAPPPRDLRAQNRLVMLDEPNRFAAESFRILRTNVEFMNLAPGARTIMVTSALEQEGKSTTVANLAVAFARAGQDVVLVDLDLRRPFLAKFFGLESVRTRLRIASARPRPGLTQVVLGHVQLNDALVPIDLSTHGLSSRNNGDNADSHPLSDEIGSLRVLPSGPLPPDAGEFVATKALDDVLNELRASADIVLIDAPPILNVGDAMTLSAKVDGMLVIMRLNLVRRRTIAELRRVLDASPATKLGFIVTGSGKDDGYGYKYGYKYGDGYGDGYGRQAPKSRFRRRQPV